MDNEEIIKKAKELVNIKKLNGEAIFGEVGSVLITEKGNFYEGISLHASCGIGTCAEHSAILKMLEKGETRIKKIVAVGAEGVYNPCGRCRELMYQVDKNNSETDVMLSNGNIVKLKDLLPNYWQ
jgi:cytidine deaminase